MKKPNDIPELDALADPVGARLAERMPVGLKGEADPELVPLEPQLPSQVPIRGFRVGSRLAISGIEYTQSVQYNSLTTPKYGND